MMKCSMCKKNIAVVFITKMIEGKQIQEGLCISCAKKQGIQPVNELLDQTGMTEEDLDKMNMEIMDRMMDRDDSDNPEEGMQNIADLALPTDGQSPNPLMGFLNKFFPAQEKEKDDEQPKEEPKLEAGRDNANQDKKDFEKQQRKSNDETRRKKVKTKNLDLFGTNLTDKALNNEVDRVIGRSREISRAIQILNRRNKNNLCLLGEPGVGKTAIAEGLAVRIASGQVPAKMRNLQIYQLDMTGIVAGTHFRGQFESRMKGIINEATALGNVVLVIDEIHNIMGAGDAEGAMNAANILKPALAKGDIQIIGATTMDEYRRHIEKDSALERRFQPILVDEPSIEESVEIIEGIKDYYEKFHRVTVSKEVIKSAVMLSERYITERFLPDKAIDVLDEAGSKANLENELLVREMELTEEISQTNEMIDDNMPNGIVQDYEQAAILKSKKMKLDKQLEELQEQLEDIEITVDDVASVIEAWTNIPVQRITQVEAEKLLHLEEGLHKRVISQDNAVRAISKAIRRNRSGLKRMKRPASFVFVGPTGVGKTELVKALAEVLFESEENMIRLDMSEFMEKHTVSKLIGSPPGYVGYDDGGQLTEKIRRKPYSVILMDEIEKAHPDVFHILLQIMDDGRLTDSHGRTVCFENTVLIMTSNAGTTLKSKGIGFTANQNVASESAIKEAMKEIFRPEFLNRLDDVVIFTDLTKDDIRKIAKLMLGECIRDLKEKDITLTYTEDTIEFLAEKGYSTQYGARPLRRAIQENIEDKMSEMFLREQIQPMDTVMLDIEDGQVVIRVHR